MTDKMNISDEFTYKDSPSNFGDLINDKRQYQFSWIKTISVLCVLVGSIFFVLIFLFTTGKNQLIEKHANAKQIPVALKTGSQSETMNQQLALAIKQSAQEHVQPLQEDNLETEKVSLVKVEKDVTDEEVTLKPLESVEDIQKQIQEAVSLEMKKTASTKKINSSRSPIKKIKDLSYKVIAGTFSNKANAKALQRSLGLKKISSYIWTSSKKGKLLYKVQVGAFPTRKEAEAFRLKISRKGYQSYIFYKS